MLRIEILAFGLAMGCSGSSESPSGANVPVDAGSTDAAQAADSSSAIDASSSIDASSADDARASSHRGFPVGAPWVSFYGGTSGLDLAKVASTFRVINLDADPDADNITDAQITQLKANGQNRVISYMNVGACEDYRSYWQNDPPGGHKSCVGSGALTDAYQGYPHEKWANLSNAAYRDLIVGYVAARLAARGVDGFFLDNMEVVEHGPGNPAGGGPCDAACAQGGLDLVWELRVKYPDLLIVMQNATSDVTRLGSTHGVPYPSLLDGVSHEEVYTAGADPQSRTEMLAWKGMALMVGSRPFWLGAEDYVGACSASAKGAANTIYGQAAKDGINEYVTDSSDQQIAPCFWSDFP